MLNTKQRKEREMVKVLPEFVQNTSTGYHKRHRYGHRCELEHECLRITNVIVNKSSEQFFNVIFDKQVYEMITRMHPNPEGKHKNAFLSLHGESIEVGKLSYCVLFTVVYKL